MIGTRTRFGLLLGLGLALASAVGLAASAQEAGKAEQRRISLRLEKADVAKVLPQLAQAMRARLDMRCDRKATVTIAFENLTVPTALTAICESAGLQWQLMESPDRAIEVTCGPAVPPPGPEAPAVEAQAKREVGRGTEVQVSEKITLDVRDAKAPDVFGVVAQLLDARLLMDPALEGKTVTCRAQGEPVTAVLDGLCKQIGAKWELGPGAPPVLKISPR